MFVCIFTFGRTMSNYTCTTAYYVTHISAGNFLSAYPWKRMSLPESLFCSAVYRNTAHASWLVPYASASYLGTPLRLSLPGHRCLYYCYYHRTICSVWMILPFLPHGSLSVYLYRILKGSIISNNSSFLVFVACFNIRIYCFNTTGYLIRSNFYIKFD